jgi:hypothetical protein
METWWGVDPQPCGWFRDGTPGHLTDAHLCGQFAGHTPPHRCLLCEQGAVSVRLDRGELDLGFSGAPEPGAGSRQGT